MSDEFLPKPYDPEQHPERRRRRRPAGGSGLGGDLSLPGSSSSPERAEPAGSGGHGEIERYQPPRHDQGDAASGGIAKGRSFQNPADEFPAWKLILDEVREEFLRQAHGKKNGTELLKQEDHYFNFVNSVVSAHPEWRVRPVDLERLVKLLRVYQFGYGALEDYMQVPDLEELYFNRYDEGFYIQAGQKHRIHDPIFENEQELMDFVRRVALENGLDINVDRPALDATLKDGSRLNATIPPIAVDGPDFVIRKHRDIPFTIDRYIRDGTMTAELANEIGRWVKAGLNIVVSGGTGSGKTSLLNALGNTFIPPSDRLLVLENRKELQMRTDDHKYFVTREDATREGGDANEIVMNDLIRYCLRKRPDRIVVGEVRGREAYYALAAWNSGHDGSFCTVHANSAPQAIRKLHMLAASAGELDPNEIRAFISDSVDIIIQVKREKHQATRLITEVIELLNPDKFSQYDDEVAERVKTLRASGDLRGKGEDLWFLPLFRRDREGRLVKVHDLIPIEGKELE